MRRFIVVGAPALILACASTAPPAPVVAKRVSPAPTIENVTAAPTPHFAATAPPPPEFEDPERAKKLAQLALVLAKRIDTFFEKEKPPSLAVAMVADGKIVFTFVLGVRDKASTAAATERTMYRIGSVTKTFTATLLLSLRDEGRVRLDDPAETYLPELAGVEYPFRDAPRITLRHLLTHTSGLPRLGDFDYTGMTDVPRAEMLGALSRTKLERAPGSGYEYSNFGMALVGEIIARVAPEKSLREALAKRVTGPLGMAHTAFDPAGVRDAEPATGYAKKDSDKAASLWHLGASEAAGGIWSTAPDMARWVAAQLDAWPPRDSAESVATLKRASLREAHMPGFSLGLGATLKDDQLKATAQSIGLAWHTKETCAYERIVWHNGGIDGFSSDIGFVPERGFGFVVLASSLDTPTGELESTLFDEAATVLEPRKAQPARETVALMTKLAGSMSTCSEADYADLLTKHFRSALPFPQFQAICQTFANAHGTCRYSKTLALDNPRAGTFALACDRGAIETKAWVSDEDGASRLSGLFMEQTGLVPSRDVVQAAREALALAGKWDSGRYKSLFATKVNEATIRAGADKVRTELGTCRLAKDAEKRGGDGNRGAALELDCDKGNPAELALDLDAAGKVEAINVRPRTRTGGLRPKERCISPTAKKK